MLEDVLQRREGAAAGGDLSRLREVVGQRVWLEL